MSSEAVNWVRDHADVSRHLYPMLLTVASYTDREGRGCRASAATLAGNCRMQERSGKRLLAELRDLGLIKPGDQNLVKHISVDRRPTVYDVIGVPMASPRGVTEQSPRHRAPRGYRGDHRVTSRGDRAVQSGVTEQSPKTFPYGEGDRAGGAQGSAPRPDANTPPAPSRPAHGYEYGPYGLCARCDMPESNRAHKDAA